MDWTGWKQWHNVDDVWNGWKKLQVWDIPHRPGAYVLSTTRTITRAYGKDEEELLHVGESGDLSNRIWCMLECVAKGSKKESHRAGWRYSYLQRFKHFPQHTLRIRWIERTSKAAAKKMENTVLQAYVDKHFELPPLNYNFPWA